MRMELVREEGVGGGGAEGEREREGEGEGEIHANRVGLAQDEKGLVVGNLDQLREPAHFHLFWAPGFVFVYDKILGDIWFRFQGFGMRVEGLEFRI